MLAWHNAEENGGWDPTDLWGVDTAIAEDMLADFDTPLTKDGLVKRQWALAMLSVHTMSDPAGDRPRPTVTLTEDSLSLPNLLRPVTA